MKLGAALLSIAALTMSVPSASAQAKPNFAAKWTVVADPNAPPPGVRGMRGLGQEATIMQNGSTLAVVRSGPYGDIKSVYNLDGSDSKNTLNIGGNSIDQMSKAKWDGDKLVITTTTNFGGNALETTQVLSLDASGSLIVDTTSPGRGGVAPTTTKMTYKRG
ncbi:MAG: hypothetical protein M3Z05_15255 [Gemmatimonadota bacterium]|nr:hypothetical protein [Gemmatimonadota bacterium]